MISVLNDQFLAGRVMARVRRIGTNNKAVAIIRFAASGVDKTVTIDVAPGERRTLLSVAKGYGVPILFNCEAGECGACLVHVDTVAVGERPVAPLCDSDLSLPNNNFPGCLV